MSGKEYEVQTCSVCIPCGFEKCKEEPCNKVHRNLDSDPYICSHGHDITFKFQREKAFASKFYQTRKEYKELIASLNQKLNEANIRISNLLLQSSETRKEYKELIASLNQKLMKQPLG